MTPSNQTYFTYKRLLYGTAMVSDKTSMNEVNQMIADANRDAYDTLDDDDQVHVNEACRMLETNAGHRLGRAGALEVLSALAFLLGGEE